jgi:hypothetical protein
LALFLNDDGVRGIARDGFDSVLATPGGLIDLASADFLAIAGLENEIFTAILGRANLKTAFVLDVLANGFDAVSAGCAGLVPFTRKDDFSITRLEPEIILTVLAFEYNEFSRHVFSSF